jgi:hypothetical protein
LQTISGLVIFKPMKTHRLFILIGFLVLGLVSARAENFYEGLLTKAEAEAPSEVQFHIIKTYGRLSEFIAKVREVEKISGWQQIRLKGDTAFAAWDNLRQDYVWNGGKFEVLFDIDESQKLKLNAVTFKHQTSKAD